MKSFILFLAFATIAIIVGLAPVYRLVWKQIKLVTGLLWEDEWMYREWWNSKWSWVGGPVTRYGGAVVISYLYYDVPASMKSQDNPTGEFPISLTLLFYSFYGTLLGIFCVIMCFGALQDVIRASSTIEATRSNKQKKAGVKHLYWYRYIQMPRIQSMSAEHGDSKASRVQEIPATVKLYDFGVVENLKRVFGRTSREWFCESKPSGIH